MGVSWAMQWMEMLLRPVSMAARYSHMGIFSRRAALYYGEDGGDLRSGLSAAKMDPVPSANCDGSHGALRLLGDRSRCCYRIIRAGEDSRYYNITRKGIDHQELILLTRYLAHIRADSKMVIRETSY
jgi:hypothetical protein